MPDAQQCPTCGAFKKDLAQHVCSTCRKCGETRGPSLTCACQRKRAAEKAEREAKRAERDADLARREEAKKEERPDVPSPIVEELNHKHAVVRVGRNTVVLLEGDESVVFQDAKDFCLRYRNRIFETTTGEVNRGGSPKLVKKKLGDLWLD